jgi:serine protease AprX
VAMLRQPERDAEFPALHVPLRLRADPRSTSRAVAMALVDDAFYPHPDLVLPRNRIRAWVDVTVDEPVAIFFGPDEMPHWPGWDARGPWQWHGTITPIRS